MSIFRYRGSKVWTMDFIFQGRRVRETTGTRSRTLAKGASPKTVNLEVGTLRAALRRHGLWARLRPDVKMLKTRDDRGRAITAEEESALLKACAMS